MSATTSLLQSWSPFFTTLTLACATLAGLLFVALSLHASVLRSPQHGNLRRLVTHTFGDFVTIMFVGLFFIAPWPNIYYVCAGTLITVVIAGVHTWQRWMETRRDRETREDRKYFVSRLRLTATALVLLFAGAVLLILVDQRSPEANSIMAMVFGGSVILLVAAMKNTWYLLAHELNKPEVLS